MGVKMNKQECKKYIKKAYKRLMEHNKTLNEENIEYEMKNVLKEQIFILNMKQLILQINYNFFSTSHILYYFIRCLKVYSRKEEAYD